MFTAEPQSVLYSNYTYSKQYYTLKTYYILPRKINSEFIITPLENIRLKRISMKRRSYNILSLYIYAHLIYFTTVV